MTWYDYPNEFSFNAVLGFWMWQKLHNRLLLAKNVLHLASAIVCCQQRSIAPPSSLPLNVILQQPQILLYFLLFSTPNITNLSSLNTGGILSGDCCTFAPPRTSSNVSTSATDGCRAFFGLYTCTHYLSCAQSIRIVWARVLLNLTHTVDSGFIGPHLFESILAQISSGPN